MAIYALRVATGTAVTARRTLQHLVLLVVVRPRPVVWLLPADTL